MDTVIVFLAVGIIFLLLAYFLLSLFVISRFLINLEKFCLDKILSVLFTLIGIYLALCIITAPLRLPITQKIIELLTGFHGLIFASSTAEWNLSYFLFLEGVGCVSGILIAIYLTIIFLGLGLTKLLTFLNNRKPKLYYKKRGRKND